MYMFVGFHHYILMNIQCDKKTLEELEESFKFNDAIIRHLTIGMKKAHTNPSPMMKEEKSKSIVGENNKVTDIPNQKPSIPEEKEISSSDVKKDKSTN